MAAWNYIRYFLFLATNWNLRLALHIIANEIKGEKKYNIRTTGTDSLRSLKQKGIDIENATLYMPADYNLLEEMLQQAKNFPIRHFVDIGCGSGRALCVAAHFGIKKLTGVDFSEELCLQSIANLQRTLQAIPDINCKIENKDAAAYPIPPDTDCIFLFNPFNEIIMEKLVNNINKSLLENPRPLTVIYLNPMHQELFIRAGFQIIFNSKKLTYLEGILLQK